MASTNNVLLMIVGVTLCSAAPVLTVDGSLGSALRVTVNFTSSSEFSEASVRREANALYTTYSRQYKLVVAYFDVQSRASWLAYPTQPGGPTDLGAVSPARVQKSIGGGWSFTQFAQLTIRDNTATVWFRDGATVKSWNVSGEGDAGEIDGTRLRGIVLYPMPSAPDTSGAFLFLETAKNDVSRSRCRTIGQRLRRAWSLPRMFVTLRSDGWFGENGPVLNPFADLTPPSDDAWSKAAVETCYVD